MAVWSEIRKSVVTHEHRLDAEFFDPKYLKINDLLVNLSCKDMLGKLANNVKKGIFDISPSRYKSEGVPLIRTFQIKTPIANEENLVYINENDHQKEFKKTELLPGDIVFTKIGAGIGDVAVLPKTFSKFNFSQNVAGVSVKSEHISSYYLISFLNSFYGRSQILRYMMPSGQGKLELRDIKKIIIPRFDASLETEVSKLMKSSEEKALLSKSLYIQAQELLEKELGLDQLVLEKPKSYETSFSEVVNGGRIDGEFYHAKFEKYLKLIRDYKHGSQPLKNLVFAVSPNFKASNNKTEKFEYLEIGDINISDGSYSTNSIEAIQLPANAKIKLHGGEIVVSQVRPTRGAIAIIDDYLERETVASGALYVFKIKDLIYREITWLFLRSIRNVFEKYCGGTSYPTIDSNYLANFQIPNFQADLAIEVSELVTLAKSAKKESEQLLDQAKSRVEELIEGAIQ